MRSARGVVSTPARGPGRELLLAAAILAIAALVRVMLASTRAAGFDEVMHLFAAKVPTWGQFFRELRADAHPPPHFLLVRMLPDAAQGLLWPRLAAIVPDLATTWLLLAIGRSLGVAAPVRALAGIAYALSPWAVSVGSAVRGYSLATAAALAGWLALTHTLVAAAPAENVAIGPRPHSSRGAIPFAYFLLCSTLAVWSEYSAAVLPVALVVAVVAGGSRTIVTVLRAGVSRWGCVALVLTALAAAVLARFLAQSAGWSGTSHLERFMRGPDDSVWAFLWRSATGELGLLLGGSAPDWVNAVLLVAAMALVALVLWRERGAAPARAVALRATPALWLVLAGLGALGLHPFGGEARQQHTVLVAAAIALMIVVDHVWRAWCRTAARATLLGATALALAVPLGRGWSDQYLDDFSPAGWPWQVDVAQLESGLGSGDALWLTPFSTGAFHGADLQRRWHLRERLESGAARFAVEANGKSLTVLHSFTPWNLGWPVAAEQWPRIATGMREASVRSAWVFLVRSEPWSTTDPPAAERTAMARDCAAAGLTAECCLQLPRSLAVRVRSE